MGACLRFARAQAMNGLVDEPLDLLERALAANPDDWRAKYSTGGVYVNFVPDGEAPIDAEYGPNYERLVALKRNYDPENLFRCNQNIAP